MIKSCRSKLTVYYPTTEHKGTFDCIITNSHGQSTCCASLEISDEKLLRTSGPTRVLVSKETTEKQQRPSIEEELQAFMSTGAATLHVPQGGDPRPQHSDNSCTCSPVQIRITSATPLPDMIDVGSEEKAASTDVTKDPTPQIKERASQAVKHKFTFSFDVVREAPEVVTELESILGSNGEPVVLKCKVTGDPASQNTCAASSEKKLSSSQPTKPGSSREPLPSISGCGLESSAAVIKVSQIKQAFESDSPDGYRFPPFSEEQRMEGLFPQELIPVLTKEAHSQVIREGSPLIPKNNVEEAFN
jgi:hypothetical protein